MHPHTQTTGSGPSRLGMPASAELLPLGPAETLMWLTHSLQDTLLEGHCHNVLHGLMVLGAHLTIRPDFGGSEHEKWVHWTWLSLETCVLAGGP